MAEIVMPKFGLTMTEGLIAAWHRKPGEPFRQGDVLFEVETEKVTNEVEATNDGVLAEILFAEGSVVPIGEVIARLSDSTSAPATVESASAPIERIPTAIGPVRGADAPSARKLMAEHGIDRETVSGSGRDGRIMKEDVLRVIATPLARRIARQEGVALHSISGSGPRGRIKAADVKSVKATPAPPPTALVFPDPARAATARRVQAAKRDIPHFYLTRHVDTRALGALRMQLNAEAEGRAKLSVTHMLVKAMGLALAAHPSLNRVWLPDGILTLETIGVGIVAETPQGLRIPVLDRADALPLDNLAFAMNALLERARNATLTSADVSGGVISISNVGMFGVDTLTPIISPPQAMILGVGAEQQLFRPDAAGQPELCRELILTLAADHRLIDGADAARFLATLAGLLETPIGLLRAPSGT